MLGPITLLLTVSFTATTVVVDTYNWRWETPLWPELYSIWFNVYEGKSAEWGVRLLYLLPPLAQSH